ncbi:HK97 gp10 family phage protein [Moraxella sp. ZJ142]|uniref:HK97 gp10 family phage protein n=1 Tax=Moraxella marmotae TaxID=3344520 RepID=UPI0035D51FEA
MTWDKKLSVDDIADELDKVYRQFAINCYNHVVALSPVRTGRYRQAHHISIGSPSYAQTGADAGLIISLPKHTYPTIYIQNNLPYALRIENGWSKQAPTGVYNNAFNSALGAL